MQPQVADGGAASGLVIDRAGDLPLIHHVVDIAAYRDTGQAHMFGDLFAGKEVLRVLIEKRRILDRVLKFTPLSKGVPGGTASR